MATQYKHMDWIFDMHAFSEMLRDRLREDDIPALAELIGVSEKTIVNWRNHAFEGNEFDHPRMSNFVKVCNALEVDPRLFFGVESSDGNR